MKNRLLLCTVTLSLAATVVAVSDTGAQATPRTTTPSATASSAKAVVPTSSRIPRPPASVLSKLTPAPIAAPVPVIPHLDPSLNAVAGVAGSTPDPTVTVDSNGTVGVIASGPDVINAAKSVGASIGSNFYGSATLQVPADKLRELAAQPGVSSVSAPTPVSTQVASASSVVSEGVAASGAQAWNNVDLGNQGQGVNIAIVDAGFGGLQAEEQAGHLSADEIVADESVGTTQPTANMCGSVAGYSASDHGTAVAEIVHQMAPNAKLYLYCVSDSGDFANAVQLILQHNANSPAADQIKIANSSLGFTGEARGDGYAAGNNMDGTPATTTDLAVRAAREHGILWVASSGNSAENHWSGTFSDHYRNVLDASGTKFDAVAKPDQYLDFDVRRGDGGQLALTDFDAVVLESGQTGVVDFTWDQWPAASIGLQLELAPLQISGTWYLNSAVACSPDSPCPIYELDAKGNPVVVKGQYVTKKYVQANAIGQAPSVSLKVTNNETGKDKKPIEVEYLAEVRFNSAAAPPAIRYDIYSGGAFSPDLLSSLDPARAAAGTVTSPADSPFALAVGAVYVGNTNGTDSSGNPNGSNAGVVPVNSLESFSSRGPTIDGRAKPDLVAYDGTSSNIEDVTSFQQSYDANGAGTAIAGTKGFYGTSAAAPHVAGAAALVLAAHPTMDASQLEAFLEAPNNNDPNYTRAPANNVSGHGRLLLGAADATKVVPVNGGRYHQVTPTQIASTVTGAGVRQGRMGAGTELTVQAPSTVPSDATALVVGLYGKGASGTTSLALYPSVYTGASTLNLSAAEPNVTITATVPLSNHSFKLRNNAAAVDAQVIMYGYFSAPSDSTGDGYKPIPLTKLVDTRTGLGGHLGKLGPNASLTVSAVATGIPAQSDVAVVNIAALNQTHSGFLTAIPSSPLGPHSVDYGAYTRDNLVLVPIVNNQFTLVNRLGTTDVTVSVVGYFTPIGTIRYTSLPAPVRLVNTATGNGGRHGMMLNGSVLTTDGGGLNGVPYNASALWLGLTAGGTGTGYMAVFPGYTSYPGGQFLDYTASRSVQNQAIAQLSARTTVKPPGLSTTTRNGSANVYQDVFGYFAPPAS